MAMMIMQRLLVVLKHGMVVVVVLEKMKMKRKRKRADIKRATKETIARGFEKHDPGARLLRHPIGAKVLLSRHPTDANAVGHSGVC
ncbi:hypothetical protein Pfo_031316 [Paulownia fortunei]|nr:hypothetical protein Pfo_031316 [Paulownia fortunei]